MTQTKRFLPRGWCLCKRGVALKTDGMLAKHYPTKLKYTNKEGKCIGTGTAPLKILPAKREARRRSNNHA